MSKIDFEDKDKDTFTAPVDGVYEVHTSLTVAYIEKAVDWASKHTLTIPKGCTIRVPESTVIAFIVDGIEKKIDKGLDFSAQKQINTLDKYTMRKVLKKSVKVRKFIGKYGDLFYE